jgi:O-antigen/teichoic acid export membrane protein
MSSRIAKRNVKAGIAYFIGNIFDKAIAFITIPVFTRLMSTSEYGVLSTYLSWVVILTAIAGLSLGNSVRTASVDYKDDLDGYISSITFLSLITGGILTALALLFGQYISGIFDGSNLWGFCVVQSVMASIIATVQMKLLMKVSYVKRTLLSSIPNLVVAILSVVLILQLDINRFYGRIWAYTLIYVIVGIGILVQIFRCGKKLLNREYWTYGLRFSIPIIFHSLSVVILAQSDRTMITWLKGSSETGIYSLIYNFSMIATVISTTLENVWIPWFTDKMQKNDKKSINMAAGPYLGFMTIMCCGLMMVSPEVLTILAPESYWSGKYMIPPIVLASLLMFLASVCIDLEYYKKTTKHIASNTMVAAVINIGLNLVFIPKYGAIAAAYATVVSYLVSFIMHYIMSRKIDSELFPFRLFVLPVIFSCTFAVLAYVFMDAIIVRYILASVLLTVLIVMLKKLKTIRR